MTVTGPATCDADGTVLEPMRTRLDYTSKVRALELRMKYLGLLDGKARAEVPIKARVGVDISRI